MNVPATVEEMAVSHTEIAAFGVWRAIDGTLFVAGYHFGPSGDMLFRINPDGSVDGKDELEAAE